MSLHMTGDSTSDDKHIDIPDEIRTIYCELSGESDDEGVSLSAIISWSVMQDAIQSAFISEVIIWKEFVNFVTGSSEEIPGASISENEMLNLHDFYQFCTRLQGIIDTNIDMTESLSGSVLENV